MVGKFKVGMKVRVLEGITDPLSMPECMWGKIGTIIKITGRNRICPDLTLRFDNDAKVVGIYEADTVEVV